MAKNEGDPNFFQVLDEMRAMHIKKGADYGTSKDPYANVRASEEFGVPAWKSAVMRANEKVTRIKAFCANGSLENESLDDSLIDLASYAIIALCLRRESLQADEVAK